MNHTIDKNYFPGFVRKAVTFTIDDGNIEMDKKFLNIVRPAGIIGTFNLCDTSKMSPEQYREMYCGYEISNHARLHPELMVPGAGYIFTDEPFDKETADIKKLYHHPTEEGLWLVNGYYYGISTERWLVIADTDNYNRLIDEAQAEFDNVFGKNACRSFVWPFGLQVDYPKIHEHIKELGYYGARDAGSPTESLCMPKDRMFWRYCAHHLNVMEIMEKFEALSDDGELKFFCLGIHSIDYETDNAWDNLKAFCKKYSGRKNEFYYSTVGDIFDYEDAISALTVTDTEIKNDSDLKMYLKIDGNPIIIEPKSVYTF